MSNRIDNATGIYMTGIRDGRPREAMATYTGARYTQHSTGVPDGKEGFITFFESFIARNPDRDIRVVRAFEDGQYVFVQAYQNLNQGGAEWVTMDFFDTDRAGQIIEHWDVIEAFCAKTPGGHSSIDGPTEVTDLDRTDDNKRIVREAIRHGMMRNGDPSRVGEFIAADCIRHNREMPDGLAAIQQFASQPDRPLHYEEIVLLAGQGNFVATLSKAERQGQPYANTDLFRLSNGKIVEHWDASEPIVGPDQQKNSGKF